MTHIGTSPIGLDDLEQEFAKILRKRRLFMYRMFGDEYSAKRVSEKIGISRAALCQWETGATGLRSFYKWKKWANAVGMKFKVDIIF